MGESSKHRIARFLRAVLSGSVLLQGIFASWNAVPVYASDNMRIAVTATSNVPPAAVADLLASPSLVTQGQISLTWTAPQGNVGNYPMPNWTVGSYDVRYSTFSVASLAGDTTTWWTLTSASNIHLAPPSFTPHAPGQLEADVVSGLIPGATYYFGIKSTSQGNVVSPIDSESASPALQASAVSPQFSTTGIGTPLQPTGLTGALGGGQFVLRWKPVTTDTAGQAVTIDHYLLSRYDTLGSTPTVSFVIPAGAAPSYTDTVGGLTYYYRAFAVSSFGKTSVASDYIDSSIQAYHYTVASDDVDTRVVIPDSLAQELEASHNSYGADLEIHLNRQQQDEVNVTLKSYRVGVFKVLGQQEVPFFAFTQMGMQVQLGLGSILGVGHLSPEQEQKLKQISSTGAGSIAQIVSVYWYNGANYVRISDPILTSNQAISVSVKNVGVYQIRATTIATQFKLTQGSPYPRLITPNDPSQNNRVFWFFDNPSGDPVSGTIYDIRGAKVRDLVMNGQSPTSNSLVWDGRDFNGAVVPSGVYLYKIAAGKDQQTGTLVVAR